MNEPRQGTITGRLRGPWSEEVAQLGGKIVIATPSADGSVETQYAASLLAAHKALYRAGVEVRYITVDCAEISVARNVLSALFLSDPDASHILFIDNDITFPARVATRLLGANLPFVGAMCPRRDLSLDAFYEAVKGGADRDEALVKAASFAAYPIPGAKPKDGFVEVSGIGTGLLLLRRDVFDQIADTEWATELKIDPLAARAGVTENYRDYFGRLPTEDGTMQSEDISFCWKYRSACGGRIFALVDETIGHVGKYTYSGRWSDLQGKD